MTDMTIKAASSQDMRELAWWVRDAADSICGQTGAKDHQDKLHEAADALDQAAAQRKGLVEALTYARQYVDAFADRAIVDGRLKRIDAALHPEGKSETSEIEAGK